MPSVARKFLMAGRGGLNITHGEPLSRFLARYDGATLDLCPAIERFTPDAMRGRMSSVFSLVVTSGPRLGDVEAGAVAGLSSARFSVLSGGLACAAGVGLIMLAFPALLRYDVEEATAEMAVGAGRA